MERIARIDQKRPAGRAPSYDGSASCGPACMAMVARTIGYGRFLNDALLVEHLGIVGSTTFAHGTELSGMRAIARALDRHVSIIRSSSAHAIREALARGQIVIANGDYYAMAPHADPNKYEGHFVLIHGLAGGRFLIHDPDDRHVETVSADDLEHFLERHHDGGHLIFVSLAPLDALVAITVLLRSEPRSIRTPKGTIPRRRAAFRQSGIPPQCRLAA